MMNMILISNEALNISVEAAFKSVFFSNSLDWAEEET